MLATLFVVSVGLAFWLLYRLRAVLFILFVAIVIGTAIKPAVEWLNRRGLPKIYGQVLIYLVLIAFVVGFFVLALPMILEQSTAIVTQVTKYYDQLRDVMVQSPSYLLQRLGFRLPPQFQVENLAPEPNGQEPQVETGPGMVDIVAQAIGYAGLISRSSLALVAVFLMSFYWVLESERAIRSLMLVVPRDLREDLRELIDEILARVGGYILGLSILSLVVGGMALVAYMLIGLPNALALAFIAGVMEAIPLVGPALGALPAVTVALASDPSKVVWVLAATIVIQFLENYLIVPKVIGRSVGVNPLLTLLALATFSTLLGLPGALMAIPLAAVIQILINRYVLRPHVETTLEPEGRDRASLLRYQAQEIAQDVRKQFNTSEDGVEQEGEHIEDTIEAIANDLDRILAQASLQESSRP